LTNIFAR